MISFEQAAAAFRQAYGQEPVVLSCAPGRLNLIGEHVDYADGCVLPVALTCGVTVAAGYGKRGHIRVRSDKFDKVGEVVFTTAEAPSQSFAAFVHALALESGATSADLLVMSDLRVGSGLSSSAAFSLAVLGALLALEPPELLPPPLEVCQLAQRAELKALNVACGIMDQYAVMHGEQGKAMLFDTWRLEHETVPFRLPAARLLIIDSGQPRRLAQSGYNLRRAELSKGFAALKQRLGEFGSWRTLDRGGLLSALEDVPEPGQWRLRHVVTEQQRVERFAAALKQGDVPLLGSLLDACHHSLSEVYEVSTPELDLLQELLSNEPGIYGARLVGGGFGGSLLALVDEGLLVDSASTPLAGVLERYAQDCGLNATVQMAEIGTGAQIQLDGKQLLLRDWLSWAG